MDERYNVPEVVKVFVDNYEEPQGEEQPIEEVNSCLE